MKTEQQSETAALFEDEWYLVRDSGELPETAFHASLHYLSSHPDGPGLRLTEAQRSSLFDAAAQRFVEIILRDLNFAERESSSARGIGRAVANYQRFCLFCSRQHEEERVSDVRLQLATRLEAFLVAVQRLDQEKLKITAGCTCDDLRWLAGELGVLLPVNIEEFFSFSEKEF